MSKLSELFQRVHDRFIDNDTDNPYICCNIEFDTIAKPYLKKKAIRIISKRLGDTYTYTSWLRKYHNELYESIDAYNGYQPGRILWLKSLVEEFK